MLVCLFLCPPVPTQQMITHVVCKHPTDKSGFQLTLVILDQLFDSGSMPLCCCRQDWFSQRDNSQISGVKDTVTKDTRKKNTWITPWERINNCLGVWILPQIVNQWERFRFYWSHGRAVRRSLSLAPFWKCRTGHMRVKIFHAPGSEFEYPHWEILIHFLILDSCTLLCQLK